LALRRPWLSGILHIEYGKGGRETKTETDIKNRESGLIIWLERLRDPLHFELFQANVINAVHL
jgi:hypothetical protein